MANECIAKYFITAVLLTSDVKRAEAAVLDGFPFLDLNRTAVSAIHRGSSQSLPEAVVSLLPVELQRVLQLAPDLRRSFVLRMLVGMSREDCAALLNLESDQVEDATCKAAKQLARIAESERLRAPIPLSRYDNLQQVTYV